MLTLLGREMPAMHLQLKQQATHSLDRWLAQLCQFNHKVHCVEAVLERYSCPVLKKSHADLGARAMQAVLAMDGGNSASLFSVGQCRTPASRRFSSSERQRPRDMSGSVANGGHSTLT